MTGRPPQVNGRPGAPGALVSLVLVLLAGLVGMHGLAPGAAGLGGGMARHATATAHADDDVAHVHRAGASCSHDTGGHPHHADATCAASGLGAAPAVPDLAPAPFDPAAVAVPAGWPAVPHAAVRAPPDLAQLQLLRI